MLSRIKKIISFLLHGEPNPTYAKVTYLQPNQQLAGKKVIITGGGRGLGFAMAKKFIAEGAEVLIAGRSADTLSRSAAEIGCKYLQLDVQDVSTFQAFIDEADRLLGGANCLVNNAGISLHENGFLDVSPEQFAQSVKPMLDEGLVDIIGGCCGTTPEHIKAVVDICR